jgi:adenosylmethionine-8-amino-7-oxononanoate aminotransferase
VALKIGEEGKVIRVAASFDMSSYTELTLTFTLPDDTTVTKTQTGGEVTLGTGVTDPDLGVLAANEYVEYATETGFLSQSGSVANDDAWKVYLTYTNTTPTPDDVFIGDCASFDVSAICP